MKSMISILILVIYTNAFALSECLFKTESKPATYNIFAKSVDDFALMPDAHATLENNNFESGWCTDHNLWVYAIPSGTTVRFALRADDSRCGYQWRDIGSVDFGREVLQVKSVTYNSKTSGRDCYTVTHNTKTVDNSTTNPTLYVAEISECPGSSAQYPYVILNIESITVEFEESCPEGYADLGMTDQKLCKKTYDYAYKSYQCDSNDTNPQGFGWVLDTNPTNDGTKIDPDQTVVNNFSETVYSHTDVPGCQRQYQECSIKCDSPLVLNEETGKCTADYQIICEEQGMVYNQDVNACEVSTQCGHDTAFKDPHSDYCAMTPNCLSENGICAYDAFKECEDGNFSYDSTYNKCLKNIDCLNDEFVSDKLTCVATPFCNEGDMQSATECINAKNIAKSCGLYARDGNICFIDDGEGFESTYHRPLLKNSISGGFKADKYGEIYSSFCSGEDTECKYGISKITTANNGKSICFVDKQGYGDCVNIDGSCSVTGEINSINGIKQLEVINGNTIVGYDRANSERSLGSIESTCSIVGKVGHIDEPYLSRSDIISAKGDGVTLKFWDPYKRGDIGQLIFLPVIPEKDILDGYKYEDESVSKLYNIGFTGFRYYNGNTYAVFNKMISKQECINYIKDTSFMLTQALNSDEELIYKGLSWEYGVYNYLDGDNTLGSCVIKSETALSFDAQDYSVKRVTIPTSQTRFTCSPLTCANHSCQYNQCKDGYFGNIYEENIFALHLMNGDSNTTVTDACIEQICDSNEAYLNVCGNAQGCSLENNIKQDSQGRCLQPVCDEAQGEEYDPETNKCVKLDCKDSVERDGKCYKQLEL